jgi:hypothetical protein
MRMSLFAIVLQVIAVSCTPLSSAVNHGQKEKIIAESQPNVAGK